MSLMLGVTLGVHGLCLVILALESPKCSCMRQVYNSVLMPAHGLWADGLQYSS